MSDEKAVQNTPEEHIGVAPHPTRNLLLVGGLVAGAGLIGLYYWNNAKSNASELHELQGFRQTMADKCKQEQFAKPASQQLISLYADSSRMQAVVQEQHGNLQRGQVNCDQVLKSLKSVDFPVE